METKEIELAKAISRAVNSGVDYKEFAKAMNHEHPTIQQMFTNVCLEWLRYLADAEENKAWVDGRNELSVKIAKELRSGLYDKDYPEYPKRLPLI